jgi:hypothetical protein
MNESVRKLLTAALFVVATLFFAQPARAELSCTYENGYCNGAGGSFTQYGMECPWGGGYPEYGVYFDCYDEQGLIYDGCCVP